LKYERVTGTQFIRVLEGEDMDTVMVEPETEEPLKEEPKEETEA
jgi:hypothetical protein